MTFSWTNKCDVGYIPYYTLRPKQNCRHFPDDIFKCIFLNEKVWLLIKMSWKFVPNGPFDDIIAVGHIMAWRRPGDKPLSEPIWLIYCRIYASLGINVLISFHGVHADDMSAMIEIMAWHWIGGKPLSKPILSQSIYVLYVTRPQWVPPRLEGNPTGGCQADRAEVIQWMPQVHHTTPTQIVQFCIFMACLDMRYFTWVEKQHRQKNTIFTYIQYFGCIDNPFRQSRGYVYGKMKVQSTWHKVAVTE